MDHLDIPGKYPAMNRIAGDFIVSSLGPRFAPTPHGHIQTDIAAACSLSGLMILQETVTDLSKHRPRVVILSDVHPLQEEVLRFMMIVAVRNGLHPTSGWDNFVAINEPMYACAEMTRKLARAFYDICASLDRPYFKFAAALAGMKLVLAGRSTGYLDPEVGKGLAGYYLGAGSKTAPYPEALWTTMA